jgi:hypothetical protein
MHGNVTARSILKKQKCLFSKIKDRRENRSFLGVGISGKGKDERKG